MDALPLIASCLAPVIGALNLLIKYFLFDLLYHALAVWVLPPRSRAGYWICFAVMWAVGNLILMTDPGIPVRLAWYVADYALVPFLWWNAPHLTRIVAASVLITAQLLTEIACMALYSVFGLWLSEQGTTHIGELAARLVAFAIALGAAAVLKRVFSARADDGESASPAAFWTMPVRSTRSRSGFAWFFLAQAFPLAALYILFFGSNPQPIPFPWVACALVLAGTCVASDLAAILSFKRYLRLQHERERTRSLSNQLELYVKTARAMNTEGERAARFRHDARNHLQTLGMLVGRGDGERARAYVEVLRCQLYADAQCTEDAQDGEPRGNRT